MVQLETVCARLSVKNLAEGFDVFIYIVRSIPKAKANCAADIATMWVSAEIFYADLIWIGVKEK